MGHDRVSRGVAVLVSATLVVAAAAMASQALALAGDGSFYLLRNIATGEVFGTEQRYFGNLVRQAPALVGVELGATDTRLLSALFGAGHLVIPALIWSLAIFLARDDRVVFAGVVGVSGLCAGTTWFFSVSEGVLAMPLTVLLGLLLWREPSWRWRHAALAVGASAVLVATYESALVTGLFLAAWAAWRAARVQPPLERWSCAIVAALSALSAVVAVRGAIDPISPKHSRSLLYFVVSLEPWPLYLAIVGLALFVAGLGPWLPRRARWAALCTGTAGLAVATASLEVSAAAAFAARGGAAIAVLALLGLLWLDWWRRPTAPPAPDGRLLAVPVLFVLAILTVNAWALRDWSQSFDTFQSRVDAARGPVSADDVIPPDRRDVLWSWTVPTLSLLVRSSPDAGVLYLEQDGGYVPFSPRDARKQIDDAYVWGR